MISIVGIHTMEDAYTKWISVKDRIPDPNVIVRVKLTNGVETLDFVNEPINKEIPFQHYLVTHWRPATSDELNSLLKYY